MKITALKCGYITNPMGVDTATPQFSWQIESDKRNVSQTAYQITVAEYQDDLRNHNKSIWNSAKIESNKSAGIIYNGSILHSRKCYYWMVQIWDTDGVMIESHEPAYFEMGLLYQSKMKLSFLLPLHLQHVQSHSQVVARQHPSLF